MSEMIKNSDVEDVLFSIRRLVSDTPETKPSSQAAGEPNDTSGALILTSALRVNDPATEPEQVDLEDMTKDMSHFRDAVERDDDDVGEFPSLEDVFAGKSTANPARRLHLSEVEEDTRVDEGGATDDPIQTSSSDEYFEDEDTGDFSVHKWTDDPDVETLGEFATPDDTFGVASEPAADVKPAILSSDLIAEDWLKDAQNEPLDTDVIDAEDETVAEIETTDVEDAHDVAVDAGETPDIVADPVEEPLEAGATDGLADFDENILDEDALRDMITEIVRDELSGDLGERITRNVRKLVRREIHRALMTREFD